MEDVGFDFEIVTADIDEEKIRTSDYKQLPLLIARGKMEAVKKKVSGDAIILCADTVVVCNGELREKPKSDDQMREWLKSYEKYPVTVYSSVVAENTCTGVVRETIETGVITWKPIPNNVIEALVADEYVHGGSGGFIFDDPRIKPYAELVEGSSGIIMGLSAETAKKFIKELLEE